MTRDEIFLMLALLVVLFICWGPAFLIACSDPRPRCRACGAREVGFYQDGGHDHCEVCRKCGARFGVQDAPFNMVERL